MKNYIIIICIMILIMIAGLVSYKFFNKSSKDKTIERKIELLQSKLKKKDQSKEVKLILSVSNGKERAKVITEEANSLDEAVNKIKKDAADFVKTNNYNTKWTKLEMIDFEKEIYIDELENNELQSVHDGSYRNGIIILENPEIILTEAELNSNGIIDYQNQRININKLNEYTKNKNVKKIERIPGKIKIFNTTGYFCDENNNILEISNKDESRGRRVIEKVNKEETGNIINNASEYLERMLKNNGEFEYGYNPITGEESEDYNILRHAGSIWALMICKENVNKDKIDKAIEFMNQSIIDKDEQTSYITEKKSNEIKLGGNALATIALCEYSNKYKDTKYIENIKRLGNGIISMQKDNGEYSHILNTNDFNVEEEYRTVYYDGEATLALLKAYGILNDEKYLEHAKKSIEYFIEKDYTKYSDHWISYAMNEIANYTDDEKYYEFGLKNVSANLNEIENKTVTSHIDFEMLLQCFELYNKGEKKFNDLDILTSFPYERLVETIKKRANYQLNSYMYPEIAMYFNNPEKCLNSFFIRQSNFRIRIDDIQHSILGYNSYLKNYEKIYK